MHVIAAKAVAFGEAQHPSFKKYVSKVVANATALSNSLKLRGINIVSDGTDTHLVLVDLRNLCITGLTAETALESVGITCNKNGIPFDPDPGILVLATQQDKAASIAGLQAGDKILKIESSTLGVGDQAVSALVKEIQNSSENPISITIDRDGVLKDLTLVPKNIDGKGTIGAQLQPNIKKETKKTKNIFELFKYTNNEFSSLLVKTIQGYKGLITNFSSTAQQLSGPVKIVEIGAQLSQQGGTGILLFAALISINLAVLNSLPLPLLDGGQLVFTLIEGFRGKPVPVKVQMVVTQSSFFLLVGLSVLLIIRDTSQLLIVQRLLNQ